RATPLLGAPPVELGDVRVDIGATKAAPPPRAAKPAPRPAPAPRTPPDALAQTLAPGTVKPIAPRANPSRRAAALTATLHSPPQRPASAPKPAAQEPAAGVGAGAVLRGLGPYASVQIALPASAVVGRGEDCDVVLEDGSVSRRHAQLARDDRGHYRLEDLGSANGTFMDGARVSSPTLLRDGSKLRFGDVELLFWRPPASAGLTPRHKAL